MREYGTIHKGFWASESLKALDGDSRLLAAYLLTSPHTTMIGAFRLPDAYACDDLGWESKQLRNGFETLSSAGFIKYDQATKWVWIIKFLAWNKPANPNIWKAAVKLAEGVPDAVSFRSEVLSSVGVSETVSEPLRNTPSPSPSQSPVLGAVAQEEILLPLEDGSDFPVTATLVSEFRTAYPKIDVLSEVRKARAWCLSSPGNRKTRRGAGKFINGWLSRANDEAASKPAASVTHLLPGGGRRAL